jgi:hypothetical protein
MTNQSQPAGTSRFQLDAGLDILDAWAQTASQPRKNALYGALFAMQDGLLFRAYPVIEDFRRPDEVVVVIDHDLALRLRISGLDTYDIVAIGPSDKRVDAGTGWWPI